VVGRNRAPATGRYNCLTHGWRILFALAALCVRAQGQSLADLPGVDTSAFLPAIRAQVEQAERNARERPSDPAIIGALAMTLHAYQQYDAAERAYTRAHTLDPQNFDWLYLLGTVQLAQGAFDHAVNTWHSALQIKPSDLPAEMRLAESLAALPDWNAAAALYRRILDGRESPKAWYGLGRAQAAMGDHAAAIESYGKACELFPAYGAAHFALAAELRRLGRKPEAERHLAAYAKNLTTEPPLDEPLFQHIHELNLSSQAHLQRGAELEKAGLLDEAIREQEGALSNDPDNVQAHVNLISLYARAGDPDKAKQNFETATRLNPGRSDAWYNYGVLLYMQKHFDDAEKAYLRALQINPDYAEAHNNLGAIYEQLGRLADAKKEFLAAITGRPDYPLPRFHLGRILVNEQKYDEAIQQLQRALTPEDDKTPVYVYALGATYARAGDRVHALEFLQRAHDAASYYGQSELLVSIDRDLKALQSAQ
jgi:tetratricopeptide (TPR) repeat protein